nr:hypothetical protein [Brevundimonas subvibrioides]
MTYALSLWAIGRSVRVRSGAALLKGASLGVLALAILGFAIWRAVTGAPIEGTVITSLGLFGFAANALAALLLIRFRNGDAKSARPGCAPAMIWFTAWRSRGRAPWCWSRAPAGPIWSPA